MIRSYSKILILILISFVVSESKNILNNFKSNPCLATKDFKRIDDVSTIAFAFSCGDFQLKNLRLQQGNIVWKSFYKQLKIEELDERLFHPKILKNKKKVLLEIQSKFNSHFNNSELNKNQKAILDYMLFARYFAQTTFSPTEITSEFYVDSKIDLSLQEIFIPGVKSNAIMNIMINGKSIAFKKITKYRGILLLLNELIPGNPKQTQTYQSKFIVKIELISDKRSPSDITFKVMNPLLKILVDNQFGNTEFHSLKSFSPSKIRIPDQFHINSSKEILIPRESVKITRNIYIPSGYKILVNGNSELHFSNLKGLVSYSPIIILKGASLSVSGDKWRGLAFINTKENKIENLTIKGGSGGVWADFKFDCVLCLYNSSGYIKRSTFLNSYAEDAINLKKSDFKLSNLHFQDLISDGLDSDFSKVHIDNSMFESIRGDALDLSGSLFKVTHSSFINAGDKAISIGEKSTGEVSDCSFKQNIIAIAIKDKSESKLTRNTYSGNKEDVIEYIKKPYFKNE